MITYQTDLPARLCESARKCDHHIKLSIAPDRVLRSREQTEHDANLMRQAAIEITFLRAIIADMESEPITECARESGIEITV